MAADRFHQCNAISRRTSRSAADFVSGIGRLPVLSIRGQSMMRQMPSSIRGRLLLILRAGIAAGCAFTLSACISTQSTRFDEFENVLASHDSATRALAEWCDRRDMADPAVIRVSHAGGEAAQPTAEIRRLLEVGPDDPLGYRHVELLCGGVVMSVAHNFYVPARLTPAMNAQLDTTDTPFGKVVEELNFTRERLAAVVGASESCPPDTVLSHRAVLRRADSLPISLVIECYTPANLVD
ncbi:chorismate--pyruvate lyase family protein [Aurantiacibacter rhizosphaerae]|uniref:chorismate--pyruvate lyase family protein n=1 Tax=Aurantiacibacter rhizosphaerae TaxID=2691582 RepID=UPI00136658BC|nr:hypothetical protein [Aurantiacibacter rhizosphaerae]